MLNVCSEILVILLLKVKLSNDLQYENACLPIDLTVLGICIVFNFLQALKQLSCNSITESGIVILSNSEQERKHPSGIVDILLEIVHLCNLLQKAKQFLLTSVIVSGICTSSKFKHALKDSSPIFFTVYGKLHISCMS